MKYWIIISSAIFILSACSNNNSVIGKYINTFEPETTHYIELKLDSSFIHYYKKSNEAAKENKGVWSLSVRPHKTEVIFDAWIDYGYEDYPICNNCMRTVQLKDGELLFNYDLPDELNFRKVK